MEDKSQAAKETEQPAYLIEGARSSASKCKTCRRKISKGALRLGVLVDGFYGPGYMWHHLECAAKRQLDKVEEAYAEQAWKHAKAQPVDVPEIESLRELKQKADEKRESRRELPYLEVDPSGRARCKQCSEAIEKGSLRVVLEKEVRFGDQVRVGPMTVHLRCVQLAIEEEDVVTKAEGLGDALRENSRGIETGSLEEAVGSIVQTTSGQVS